MLRAFLRPINLIRVRQAASRVDAQLGSYIADQLQYERTRPLPDLRGWEKESEFLKFCIFFYFLKFLLNSIKFWILTNKMIKSSTKSKRRGQLGTVTKELNGETITVQFAVNGTMPILEEQDALEAEGQEILWSVWIFQIF